MIKLFQRENLGKIIAALTLIMLVVTSILVARRIDSRPRTDDAFLLADIANVAPDVSGRIISLNVGNNQTIRAGDVLFVVDPEPYKLKLDAARAQFILASTTLTRNEPLVGKGYVTAETIDQQRAAKENARAAEALAQRDFENTTVKAPFNGKIAGLNIAVGEYAAAGHPIFTLINTEKWWAVGNFRETEITRMKHGTPATVYIMANKQTPIIGHVDSVGWGVLPDDAAVVNGLPRIPKTLNWVRLAQRFPVRILLENPPDDLMRLGASAVVVVRYQNGS